MGQHVSTKNKSKTSTVSNPEKQDSSITRDDDDNHPGCVGSLRGHRGSVFCVTAVSPKMVVSGSEDRTVRVWRMHHDRKGDDKKEEDEEERKGEDQSIQRWDCIHVLEGHKGSVTSLTWFEEQDPPTKKKGFFIFSGSLDHTIKVWHVSSSASGGLEASSCVATLTGHTDHVYSLCGYVPPILIDSKYQQIIISGSSDRSIKMWRKKEEEDDDDMQQTEWECYKTLEGHEEGVRCLLVLPNNVLASGAYDTTVRLWDIETGKCLRVLNGHQGESSLNTSCFPSLSS